MPEQRIRLLWPALATAIAFPVLIANAFVFLLWTIHAWNTPVWVVLLSVILLAALGLYATWRLILAWAKRNFQFSLRGMLIAVSVLAITIGVVSHQLHQPMRLSQAVLNVAENGGYPEHWTVEDENWLEARLGYDPFGEVLSIKVRTDQAVPSLLHNSDAFTELEQLSFMSGTTDASFKHAAEFNKLPKLSRGSFYNTQMTDNGMQHLEDWTRVRHLFFNGGAFTDKGLEHLTNLKELESLFILGDEIGILPITDKGLTHVGKMANLKKLHLIGIPITDAGLENLQDLTNLERLSIRRTNVTENGLHSLCKALPNCLVVGDFASFPIIEQIRQISIWKDYPERQQLLTISDPGQIAEIIMCLERFVRQHKGRWSRDWDGDTQDSISLEFQGPNRLLCRPSFGDGFLQYGWGFYSPLSRSDASELRQILGIDTSE
jgi:hypothetical protein